MGVRNRILEVLKCPEGNRYCDKCMRLELGTTCSVQAVNIAAHELVVEGLVLSTSSVYPVLIEA